MREPETFTLFSPLDSLGRDFWSFRMVFWSGAWYSLPFLQHGENGDDSLPFLLVLLLSLGQGCLVTFAVDITLLLHYTLLQRTLHSLPQKGGRMAGVLFGTFLIFGISLLVHLLSVLRLVLAAFTDGGFN